MQTFNAKNENFIKSYRVIRQLPINLLEANFLELVLSRQLNDSEFYESDKTISEYLMLTNVKSCKNMISRLNKLGYITTTVISNKKKETWGGKTRFVKINIDYINEVLSGIEKEETIQPKENITLETPTIDNNYDDEPMFGEFPEQDNEYTRMFEDEKKEDKPKEEIKTLYYSHEAMLQLLDTDKQLIAMRDMRAKQGKINNEEYTAGLYEYLVKNNDKAITMYKAIISNI